MKKQSAIFKAIKHAGNALLTLSKKKYTITKKNAFDVVTEGDFASEKILLRAIHNTFPEHSILAEESGIEYHNKKYLWAIDPLDGTINFEKGLDEWCISVALLINHRPCFGIVYHPHSGKLFHAEKGKGAFCNGTKLQVSNTNKVINAVGASDMSSKLMFRTTGFQLMTKMASHVRGIRIFGAGALHLCKVADGSLDFYFKNHVNIWDYAAGTILIREAGGKVKDFNLKDFDDRSETIVASNSTLSKSLCRLLRKYNSK